MKRNTSSLYTKLLSFILVLLGFQSCDKDDPNGGGNGTYEYGVPSATYKVKGNVVDNQTNQPVKNIQVILSEWNDTYNTYGHGDTIYTNSNGDIDIKTDSTPSDTIRFKLRLNDIDGAENGEYQNKETDVVFIKPTYTNGSGWDKGTAEKNIGTVKLDPKQ